MRCGTKKPKTAWRLGRNGRAGSEPNPRPSTDRRDAHPAGRDESEERGSVERAGRCVDQVSNGIWLLATSAVGNYGAQATQSCVVNGLRPSTIAPRDPCISINPFGHDHHHLTYSYTPTSTTYPLSSPEALLNPEANRRPVLVRDSSTGPSPIPNSPTPSALLNLVSQSFPNDRVQQASEHDHARPFSHIGEQNLSRLWPVSCQRDWRCSRCLWVPVTC